MQVVVVRLFLTPQLPRETGGGAVTVTITNSFPSTLSLQSTCPIKGDPTNLSISPSICPSQGSATGSQGSLNNIQFPYEFHPVVTMVVW